MSQTPTPNQQNMIQMIQPAQATRLLEALKEELAQARAAGADTAKARQHYARAEQIKQVLVNYRQQQQQRAAAQQGPAAAAGNAAAGGSPAPSMASNANGRSGPYSGAGSGQGAGAGAGTGPGSAAGTGVGAGTGAGAGPGTQQARPSGSAPAPATSEGGQRPLTAGVTTEKYNQVRNLLSELERKIRTLEGSKRPDMPADELTQIDNQLQEQRLKFGQYSKFAAYMKNQLLEQARASGSTAPGAPANTGSAQKAPTPAAAPMGSSNINTAAGTPTMTPQVASTQVPGNDAAQTAPGGAGTPQMSGSKMPSPSAKEPTVPGVNLSQITKPSIPSMPISSTLNVKPQTPITLKPGANNIRPTLTAGGSSGLGHVVSSPAIVRMPTMDMASSGPIQDNGGRVLTKRKLTELVNTIGADEGDGKTTIDGDVEELLLDLADEFVNSVTTFACRLAKHRKTDTVDVRDVQLHLERNWNIRIPGHAMDEIRSMRKWQPTSSYNQKVSGVDIVKAVNGNING